MLGPLFDWNSVVQKYHILVLGRKSSGQKDRNYLLQNRAVIDLGVCLGVKALFQPLPPCFDPDLIVHMVYPADSLILSLLKL